MFPLRGLLGTSEARVGLNFVLVATGGNMQTHPVSILYLDLPLAKDVFCQLENGTHTEKCIIIPIYLFWTLLTSERGSPARLLVGHTAFTLLG